MQLELIPATTKELVPGFRYHPEVLNPAEELALAAWAAGLPLKPFEFRGYLGNRRTESFGLRYDYIRRVVAAAQALPDVLVELRRKVAGFCSHPPEAFAQALVTEYPPGAPIGWHRDKPQFGDVMGVSLLAPAMLRFRLPIEAGWERRAIRLEPRSVYVLSGVARHDWQHSIPPQAALRYSVTFRTLAASVQR